MTAAAATGSRIPDDDELARYLLGELPVDEEAAIDDALADDQVWQAVQRAEDELLDAHAAGRLDGSRRDRLTRRLAASPRLRERLALIRDLGAIAGARRHRPRKRIRLALAAAALAAAAAIAAIVTVRGRPAGHDRADQVVALALLPPTRAGALPVVDVAGRAELALSIAIDAEEAFPRYRVTLRARGAALWSAEAAARDGALAVRVPVAALGPGVHELAITGVDARGAEMPLGTRSFGVAR